MDWLAEELSNIGLDLNAKKSRIFTTELSYAASEEPTYVDTAGDMVEVVRSCDVHKYLGISLPGILTERGKVTLSHRLHCA